ncbi:MAG TPA: 23S rRNA (adenine(2503)-C(2))-methyltransferase RlmN [Candidatus Margulisiibacteriota bacterium]|nr:23S rRNA (adenine(2503)-C(2))-methyltransferase RlmN [Candidatus Margulisiibacteriota bacterium]
MPEITELSLEELKKYFRDLREPEFHAVQLFNWIYKKGATEFSSMSNLPKGLRKNLEEKFSLHNLELIKSLRSIDGTEKFLLRLKDGGAIEAVSIPFDERVTACISSQLGCRFTCSFCASGQSGFKRNLTTAEMLGELRYIKNNSLRRELTHLVFMGTGEPLDNYDNLIKAIRVINSPEAFNIGARRITISTAGVIPGIKKLSAEGLQVELSVSLHAADEATRSKLMPINKKYPLKELINACAEYIDKTNRQVTFEYILIKGVNSDLQKALKLSKILAGLNCKVNLIPFNPIEGLQVETVNKLEAILFRDYLAKHGINVTMRRERGRDINAACGQLRLRYA